MKFHRINIYIQYWYFKCSRYLFVYNLIILKYQLNPDLNIWHFYSRLCLKSLNIFRNELIWHFSIESIEIFKRNEKNVDQFKTFIIKNILLKYLVTIIFETRYIKSLMRLSVPPHCSTFSRLKKDLVQWSSWSQ